MSDDGESWHGPTRTEWVRRIEAGAELELERARGARGPQRSVGDGAPRGSRNLRALYGSRIPRAETVPGMPALSRDGKPHREPTHG